MGVSIDDLNTSVNHAPSSVSDTIPELDTVSGLRTQSALIKFPRFDDPQILELAAQVSKEPKYEIHGEVRNWNGPTKSVYSGIMIQREGIVEPLYLGEMPCLGAKGAREAVEASVSAYDNGLGAWPMASMEERICATEKCITLMLPLRQAMVAGLMLGICKTREDAENEFDRTIKQIRAFIEEARILDAESRQIVEVDGVLARIGRTPHGPCLFMPPSNYPFNEAASFFAALLMGNTVVLKTSKDGSKTLDPILSALAISYPPGVINVISGDGPEEIGAVMSHGGIESVTFLGTGKVAAKIFSAHPNGHRIHRMLGLESANPAIILPGTSLEEALAQTLPGAIKQMGRRCTANSKIHVPASLAPALAERLAEEVTKMAPGMPHEKGVELTPLPTMACVHDLSALLSDACAKGARVVNPRGGETTETYFHPAVVYPVDATMRLSRESQFGPLIVVMPYTSVDDVIKHLATVPYQQQATIVGGSVDEQAPIARALSKIGVTVNLNLPCKRRDHLPFTAKRGGGIGELSNRSALLEYSRSCVLAAPLRGGEEILEALSI